jgi:hypothetical protein
VTIDTRAATSRWIVVPGDAGQERGGDQPITWSYTTSDPGSGWTEAGFDDKAWRKGPGGFGTDGTPGISVRTAWDTPAIWLRTAVDLPSIGRGDQLSLHLFHDEDVDVYVNGKPLYRTRGYVTSYDDIPLDAAQKSLFASGRNVLAVSCRQTGGGQGIDVGLKLQKEE